MAAMRQELWLGRQQAYALNVASFGDSWDALNVASFGDSLAECNPCPLRKPLEVALLPGGPPPCIKSSSEPCMSRVTALRNFAR